MDRDRSGRVGSPTCPAALARGYKKGRYPHIGFSRKGVSSAKADVCIHCSCFYPRAKAAEQVKMK